MDMNPAEWEKIKALFEVALEQPAAARKAFLAKNCPNEAIRSQVEKLLLDHEEARSFLDESSLGLQVLPADILGRIEGSELNPGFVEDVASLGESPQDTLIGCRVGAYQIDRCIGTGGMASVYLASRADAAYQKQVAIKIVRSGSAGGEILDRFRNERQTLAALDHPNIVKLLDGGCTERGFPFLVMDYVEGKPIDVFCDGRTLSIEQRLSLFCKVCAAVQHAHDHQVIHRDLKPGNIIVTDEATPKLLDFGIAKVLNPSPWSNTLLTQTATRRMTPAYASPEQMRGEAITAATDVYSLGVVLYELLTGHRPYHLKHYGPADFERAICEEEPESPSTAINRLETTTKSDGTTVTITPETVSRSRGVEPGQLRSCLRGDLDNVVLKALQKEPSARFPSANALADDLQRHLDHMPVRARRSTLRYRTSKFVSRHKTEVIASTLIAFVLASGILAITWEARHAREAAQADIENQHSKGRRSVAVLGFKNLSGKSETAWISTALSEMLTTELAAGAQLRITPSENVAQAKINLALSEADALSRETLRRVRKNLNSDFVVLGSYLDQGESGGRQIRLDVRVQDAVTGETLAAATYSGTEGSLSDLVTRTGAALRTKLGAGEVPPDEFARVQASSPVSPEAARLYSEGLARLRVFDAVEARSFLEKSIAAEPRFALAHSALADTWRTIGHDAEAKVEAKAAFDLAGSLPREQVLLIEGSYRQAARDWDKAIEIYKTLFNFFPDNLEHGLRLSNVQTAAGKGHDALETLQLVRKLPPPDGTDARIDLAEGVAANSIADYKRQASAASVAAQKAENIGARLIVARARLTEGRALMELGEPNKAIPLLEQAMGIYSSTGDRFGLARVLQNMGLAFFYQSNFVQAKKTHEEALAIQTEFGNRANQAKLWNGMGMILERQNDLDGAKRAYQQTLQICRELDDRPMIGTATGNIGSVEAQQGDYRSAHTHFQESLTIARQVGEKSAIGLQLGNLAQTMVMEGNAPAAKPLLLESVEISRETGKKYDLGTALVQLGDLLLHLGDLAAAQDNYVEAQQVYTTAGNQADAYAALSSIGHVQAARGDLVGARKTFEQALVPSQKLRNMRVVLDLRAALASIALEEGNFSDAESGAREALEGFRAGKDQTNEAVAGALLADALLSQNKVREAQAAVAQARKLTSEASDREAQIYASLVQAKIWAASDNYPEAVDSLKQIVADARKWSLSSRQLEARLALGETEIKGGNLAQGRAVLKTLERDANAMGFSLIARKAAAARRPGQPNAADNEKCACLNI